jgi:uncharacterized protein YukE
VVASVAEVKAAIDAAIQQVTEGQMAVRLAGEKLAEAQQSFAAAVEGSGHESINTAQAALTQANQELEECLTAMLAAVEQAQTYVATL